MKITLFLLLALPCIAVAQSVGIPPDSLDLLAKLKEFESTEREKFEEIISKKRAAVVMVLERHLDRETKAGNLDRALQLRKSIEQLKATPLVKESEPIVSKTESSEAENLNLAGTTWVGLNGKLNDAKVEFFEAGRMKVTSPEAPRPWGSWMYRVDDDDIFITPTDSVEIEVRVSRKGTQIEIDTWGEIERQETPNGEQGAAGQPATPQ